MAGWLVNLGSDFASLQLVSIFIKWRLPCLNRRLQNQVTSIISLYKKIHGAYWPYLTDCNPHLQLVYFLSANYLSARASMNSLCTNFALITHLRASESGSGIYKASICGVIALYELRGSGRKYG